MRPKLSFGEQGTLWESVGETVHIEGRASFETPPYTIVTAAAQLEALLPRLSAAPFIGVDTETTGLDPFSDHLRLVQLATPDLTVVVDAQTCPLQLLTPLFTGGRELIFHNAIFDLRFLTTAGLPWPVRLFDTMLMSQLLGAGTAEGFLSRSGLELVVARYLELALAKTEQRSQWEGSLTKEQIEYAVRDAAVLLPLAERLKQDLHNAGLERVAGIEHRCVPALAWLELTGLPIDADRWLSRAQQEEERVRTLEEQLHALVGRETVGLELHAPPRINWQSPKQILAVLRSRGHRLATTNAATLANLADPLAPVLLEYREAVSRAGTFGQEWLEHHQHPRTGRIHADYIQLGAPSGRMSCINPNAQNIPRDPEYRSCIRTEEGKVIIKADFSQIELRIAAAITQDPAMLSALQLRQDLHTLTAARILNLPLEQIERSQRQLAKALNFGLLYGMGARGLREYAAKSYNIVLTEEQARRLRQAFFQTYVGLSRWHRTVAAQLAQTQRMETRTLTGRRQLGVRHFTVALNSPVQGLGADGLKLALARLFEHRHEAPKARLIATVHDEILAECPGEAARQTVAWLTRHMQGAMDEVLGGIVPIEVETQVGPSWAG